MNASRMKRWIGGAAASISLFALPLMASAQSFAQRMQEGAGSAAASANLGQAPDLVTVIGRVINFAIGLIGIILLCFFLYAGFLYLTSAGNKDAVAKAQNIMKTTVIGVVIVVGAYAIANFVLSYIVPTITGG
jgi:uncharacterized SAM-binding protein YcdF (DUF218 family)